MRPSSFLDMWIVSTLLLAALSLAHGQAAPASPNSAYIDIYVSSFIAAFASPQATIYLMDSSKSTILGFVNGVGNGRISYQFPSTPTFYVAYVTSQGYYNAEVRFTNGQPGFPQLRVSLAPVGDETSIVSRPARVQSLYDWSWLPAVGTCGGSSCVHVSYEATSYFKDPDSLIAVSGAMPESDFKIYSSERVYEDVFVEVWSPPARLVVRGASNIGATSSSTPMKSLDTKLVVASPNLEPSCRNVQYSVYSSLVGATAIRGTVTTCPRADLSHCVQPITPGVLGFCLCVARSTPHLPGSDNHFRTEFTVACISEVGATLRPPAERTGMCCSWTVPSSPSRCTLSP